MSDPKPKEGDVDPETGQLLAYQTCDCGHRYFDAPLVPASRSVFPKSCRWCIAEAEGTDHDI